jgi:hypothetical protein
MHNVKVPGWYKNAIKSYVNGDMKNMKVEQTYTNLKLKSKKSSLKLILGSFRIVQKETKLVTKQRKGLTIS